MTAPPQVLPPAGRDLVIDALRGVAALVVVLHHLNAIQYYAPNPARTWWQHVTSFGYLGVPVFFVLSGFCIGRTWDRRPGAGLFFARRFRRIFPPYLASLFLVLGGLVAWRLINGVNDVTPVPTTPGHWLATLTLCTDPASGFSTVNWVYWSLTNEVFYYLVLGLLLLVPGQSGPRRAAFAAHAGFCLLELSGHDFRGTPLFFVDHWGIFALGLGALLLVSRRPEAPWFLGISAVHFGVQYLQQRFTLDEAVGLIAFGLVLMPHAAPVTRILQPLAAVGRISYSLYLVHVPVGVYFFMRMAVPFLHGSSLNFVLSQVIGLSLVLAVAAVFFRWVELPFSRLRPAPPAG